MTDRATLIAQNLAHHFAPGQSLLEIGAGKGHVSAALKQAAGVDLRLVDVVDYNETELPVELYDGVRLPFRDASFDYSLLIFVLHHTPDPVGVMGEALRVSRCGVLVVENHVEGWVRKQATRVVDSIPHFQHGVPICYQTRSISEWHKLFEELPASAELLARFRLGFFWENFVTKVSRLPATHRSAP